MEPLKLDEVVAQREARGSGAVNGMTEGVEPAVVPLTWVDPLIKRRPDVLSKLCQVKPEIDGICALCMSPGTSRCGPCGQRYCSKRCQDDGWRRHKLVCKAFARVDYSKRPSNDHFLVIVLPTDSKEAEVAWCKLTSDASGLEIAHPDVNRLSSCPLKGFTVHINTSVATGRLFLGHGLALLDIYNLKEPEKNGLLNVNKCINNLSAPGALTFFAGPHVVFAFEGNDVGLPAKGIDVVPNDWRYATDCIVLKPTNPFFTDLPSLAIPSAMSTKINNTQSLLVSRIYGIQKPIESVVAPISYWPMSGPSALAFQIGLPWKTRYVLGSEIGCISEEMKYLKRIYRPKPREGSDDRSYDWVASWKGRCGSMIILSIADIRVVHEHHVLAFNKYLDYSLKRRIVPSRRGFLDYWDKYIAVVAIRSDVTFIANPYHELPLSEELTVAPGEDAKYRKALMNLLGHFASREWKMEVEEKDGVLIPKDVLVPFDSEGSFEFSEEDRDVLSGLKEIF